MYNWSRSTIFRSWSLWQKHIRISWIYVKSCLIINYLGQGAYVLQLNGPYFNPHLDVNPFAIIPSWFLWFSVIIATIASIIASQALISGSFSMIREAISLNLWPKLKIIYPSLHRGQLYIPTINTLLYLGCLAVVFIFVLLQIWNQPMGLPLVLAC